MNRRTFVTRSTAAATLVAAHPFHILKARSPNERINLAFIGAGGKGAHAIRTFQNDELVNFAAFADVDEVKAAESFKNHPNVPRFKDFRKLLDRHDKDIDAVVISTPDHMHHYPAKWCMKMGKPIYLEKPLAHSIEQCRELAALEKETGLACQMGNQGHSGIGIKQLKTWIDTGILGDIEELVSWNPGRDRRIWTQRPPAERVPDTLDWNLWLGAAEEAPYNSEYLPGSWRWWFDFGHGSLGDWACHNMDAPYYALNLGLPSEVRIRSTGPTKYNFPNGVEVNYSFPREGGKDLKYTWYNGDYFGPKRPKNMNPGIEFGNKGGGTLIIGSKASVVMKSHAGSPRIFPETTRRELTSNLPKVEPRSSHYDNWLRSIKGEEKPRSHFAYSAQLTEVMHYGNIALKINRDLKIDPKQGKIIGDEEATYWMSGPKPRKFWKI